MAATRASYTRLEGVEGQGRASRSLIIRSFVSSFIGRPPRQADLAPSFSLSFSLSSRTRGQSTVPAFPLRDLQIHGLPALCLSPALSLSLLASLLSSLGIHMRAARSPSKNVVERGALPQTCLKKH